MILVCKGKSNCIIKTERENAAALFAATELQNYVKQSTGALIDINPKKNDCEKVIFIGGKNAVEKELQKEVEKLGVLSDGFVTDIKENSITITANVNRGLIFGVYRFLEKFLNVRFFNIDCEVVPDYDNIEIAPQRVIENPAFIMRSYLTGKQCWREGEEFRKFYLKMKQCNEHTSLKEEKYGGACPLFGRNGAHNMSKYVPFDIYGSEHPEFYEIGTSPFTGEYGYTTLDLQNGITEDCKVDESMDVSVFKVVLSEMKKDILANPNKLFFQFEQEDGNICKQYEKGSIQEKILNKYGRSGILIRFCNLLATELKKWSKKELNDRPIFVETFGYAYCQNAPVKYENGVCVPIDQTVVATDNLVIRLAQETNYAWHHFDKNNVPFVKRMSEWRAVCDKFMFWSYDMDDSTHIWYFPSLHACKNNVIDIKDYGAIYIMYEASEGTKEHWQADMRGYIYSNLMWNPNQSAQALYEDYMENYYQTSADGVKRIVAILENYSKFLRENFSDYNVNCFGNYRHKDLVNEKLLNRLLDIYEKTEKELVDLAPDNMEQMLLRLRKIKVTLLHMKAHKVNHELFDYIKLAGVTRFCGMADVHEHRGQTLYNTDIHFGNPPKIEIPKEVKQLVCDLDVYSISDVLNIDSD